MGCNLCPFKCNIDRINALGKCKCGVLPKLALASIHFGEEPCISGENGSGTVFFSGCNLGCVFCQNHKISHSSFGKEVSMERLAEIFLELQDKNVNNINLVSPTPYVKSIIKALDLAKTNGLKIPVVYNTNSYENVETIKMLDGYVDIYLPDLKYFDDKIGKEYSKISNYFDVASKAILEMQSQVPNNTFNSNGIMQKGIIVRHLILPGNIMQTKKILNWIESNLPSNIYISIMAQYFPTYEAKKYPLLNRKISKKEYDIVLDLINNFENGYIQELSDCEEEYVPNFDLSGI